MASYTLTDAPVFEAIPVDTILEAEIIDCEERETPFDIDKNDPSKGKQHQISFRFKITEDGEFSGRTLFGNTPTWFNNHPNCKLRIWTQEILAMDEIPLGFTFDTEDLVGLQVKIIVGNRDGKAKDGSAVVKDFVSDVVRMDGGLGYTGSDDIF